MWKVGNVAVVLEEKVLLRESSARTILTFVKALSHFTYKIFRYGQPIPLSDFSDLRLKGL